MTKIIFEYLFFLILLIALELLFIWIILLIGDWTTDSSSKEEEKEDECEQHLCADGDIGLNEFENVLEDYGIEPENVFSKDKDK